MANNGIFLLKDEHYQVIAIDALRMLTCFLQVHQRHDR